jgi:hypothetical protein
LRCDGDDSDGHRVGDDGTMVVVMMMVLTIMVMIFKEI